MNERAFLEMALLEIQDMLATGENAEALYQQWFERHPLVLKSLGYIRALPHPRFTNGNDNTYIPDFLAERIDGLWEIFELKRPDTSVLKPARPRVSLYSEMEIYASQCREYATALIDKGARDALRERYGIVVQPAPDSVIVAGRSEGLDRIEVDLPGIFGPRIS